MRWRSTGRFMGQFIVQFIVQCMGRRFLGVILSCAMLMAWPGVPMALDRDEARHLLLRTGFGASPEDIATFAALSRAQAVRRLLDGAQTRAESGPPAWTAETRNIYPRLTGLNADERRALVRMRVAQSLELKSWWYGEMLATRSPLTERMTLFWHNHFTSGLSKVRAPHLLYRQNVLLRAEGLGNFARLLHAVARDPAMVAYLDNSLNRRQQPNENFARELLELFTLGEGHYGERDIKEAARAFTGWTLDRDSGRFVFNARAHDFSDKSFLGRRGSFDGGDILDILLAQRRTAEFVVEKLWREFVSPMPDAVEVARLAATFRDSGYDIRSVMQALLTSPAFWDPRHRGELVKSPVELLVGTIRSFESTPVDTVTLARYGRRLGQDLFDPPNVKGWPGYTAWITSDTLLVREQFLQRLLRGDALGEKPAMAALPPDEVAALLLPRPPVGGVDVGSGGGERRSRFAAAMLDPVYQLK